MLRLATHIYLLVLVSTDFIFLNPERFAGHGHLDHTLWIFTEQLVFQNMFSFICRYTDGDTEECTDDGDT